MEIIIQTTPRALFHTDCPKNRFSSGIVKELVHDNDAQLTRVQCLHCEQTGNIPYGTPFNVRVCIEDT